MPKLKLGDRVSIKLNGNKLVGPYSDFTEVRTFDIVGYEYYNYGGYYLYIPSYITISDTIKVDSYNYKKLGVLPKFIGEDVLLVSESKINSIVSVLDGMFCDCCKEFYDYAQPNEGDKLVCWSCRQNPYR
jgi:hypothetical protein